MLFSVIIPVYNVEKYLHQCINSVLMQTFQDYELILVDDGSKDGSGAICDGYAQKESRVRVIHKVNGGQSTARNAGLRIAQGDYIVFLDSDDFYVHENVLIRIAEQCAQLPDIIAFKYKKFFDETGKYGACGYGFSDIQDEDYSNTIRSLVEKDAFFCSAWSKAVRRSVLAENGIFFDEGSRCEDMDWYFNVITHSKSMKLVDDVMVGYRQRSNSVTSTKSIQTIDNFIAFFQKWTTLVEEFPDKELSCALRSALAKLFTNLMIAYCAHDDRHKKKRFQELSKYSELLRYQQNPRVKKIGMVKRTIGFRATMFLLGLAIKLR